MGESGPGFLVAHEGVMTGRKADEMSKSEARIIGNPGSWIPEGSR